MVEDVDRVTGVRGWVRHLFFRPVDAASLAVFRIALGALMLFEAINYGLFLPLDGMYRETDLLFKYAGFEWVRLPPGPWLEIGFAAMALGAIGVILGLFFRASAILLLVTFSYLFLLDQALYLNHFYLAILYIAILACTPAHRLWSLDARRRPGDRLVHHPELAALLARRADRDRAAVRRHREAQHRLAAARADAAVDELQEPPTRPRCSSG